MDACHVLLVFLLMTQSTAGGGFDEGHRRVVVDRFLQVMAGVATGAGRRIFAFISQQKAAMEAHRLERIGRQRDHVETSS